MLALWQHEPLSVRRLGELVSLEPATLSPLLKRLEAIGYLTRARDAGDERIPRVALTDSGRSLRELALDVPPMIMAKLSMDVERLRALHATLTEVIAHTEGKAENCDQASSLAFAAANSSGVSTPAA